MPSAVGVIQAIDLGLQSAAGIIRIVSGLAKWNGGVKLASELERVAGEVDAFRTEPVYFAEIEANRLSPNWNVAPGGEVTQLPAAVPPDAPSDGGGNG